MAILELCNLSVTVGKNVLVKRFSHEFKSGTIVALVGNNGSGKTTLLKTIAGLNGNQQGQVFIDKRALASLTPNLRAQYISFLLQHAPEQPYCSASGRIAHGLMPALGYHHGVDAHRQALILDMAQRLNIGHLLDRTLSKMSGGEQRLVHIAKCLINPSAKILLLDEPSVFLDFMQQTNLLRNLKDQKDRGRLVFFSSHDAAFINRAADSIVMIKERGFFTLPHQRSSLSDLMSSDEIAVFADTP